MIGHYIFFIKIIFIIFYYNYCVFNYYSMISEVVGGTLKKSEKTVMTLTIVFLVNYNFYVNMIDSSKLINLKKLIDVDQARIIEDS